MASNTIMQRIGMALQRMTGFNAGFPQGKGVSLTGSNIVAVGAIPLRGEAPTDYQRTGNTVRLRGFERHPVVMACVRAIVEIASAVPLQLYSKKIETGDDEDVREVIKILGAKAPGQILVDAPSPFLSAQRLRALTFVHYLVYGNAFWFLERPETKTGNGTKPGTPKAPINIRIIHPEDVMTVYVDERGYPLWYMWRDMLGYMHTSPATDLMHFRDLNAKGLVFGFPRAASALQDIIGDDEASQFVRETVTNSGAPNAYAIVNEETTLEEAQAAEAAFYEKMVKRGNRGRFVFMGGVKDIKAVGFNLRDLEFPDLRRVSREDICAAFGVDPRMIGITSASRDAGLSGTQYREARVRLIQQTIEPTMRGFVSELDLWLAPEFGDAYYRFDPDALQALVEDDDATSSRVRAEVAQGIRTVEEGRKALSLPTEYKDGDLLLIQKANMTPTSVATATGDMTPEEFSTANAPLLPFGAPPGAGDPNAAPPTSPADKGTVVPTPDASTRPDASKTTGSDPNTKSGQQSRAIVGTAGDGSGAEVLLPLSQGPKGPKKVKITSPVLKRGTTVTGDERLDVWRAFDTRATNEESKYRRAAMLQFASEQRTVSGIMGRDTPAIAKRKIERLYQPNGTVVRQWTTRMRPVIAGTFFKGARTVLHGMAAHRVEGENGTLIRAEENDPKFDAQFGFNVSDPNVQQAIRDRSVRLAQVVGETTGQTISDALAIGMKDGMSMVEMSDLINQMAFGGTAGSRAMTIARTESIGALNQGQFTAAMASGVMEGKEWVTQGDDLVRDSHDACEAEGIIDVTDYFENGLMYPGDAIGGANQPEELINCRCTLLLYDSLENVGQSTVRWNMNPHVPGGSPGGTGGQFQGPNGMTGGGVFGMDPSGGGVHVDPKLDPPVGGGLDPIHLPGHEVQPKVDPAVLERDRARFKELQKKSARINNDLLEYIDTPDDPTAQSMMNEMKEITKEVHTLQTDDGSWRDIKQPGGPLDVAVVGAGPGGMGAAINSATDGLDVTVFDAQTMSGGQSKFSSRIENLPGFPLGVSGRRLASNTMEQAQRLGSNVELGVRVVGLTHDPETGIKTLTLSDGRTVQARAVVLAGGVEFRKLEFPGSEAKGVVVGDGEALTKAAKGGVAVVIGGSNGAAQAALGAARSADHVYLMSRSRIETGMSDYQVQALRVSSKITVIENDEIAQAFADEHGNVSKIMTKSGREIPAQGVGVFVGSMPNTDWLPTGIAKAGGKIVANETMETNIPGVFAVGDMRVGSIGRVGTAVSDGQTAEKGAYDYFMRERKRHGVFDKIGKKSMVRAERPTLSHAEWNALVDDAFASDEDFPFIGQTIEPDIESMDGIRSVFQRDNPYHDEIGRFTTADGGVATDDPPHAIALKHHMALRNAAAHAVTSAQVPDGGFTLHDDLSPENSKGYFVSIAGHETQVPVTQFTSDALLHYRDSQLATLKSDPALRIGGWHNSADNLVYLDMSKRFPTKEAAIDFGTKHGQIAGYDAFTGSSFHIGARAQVHTMLGLTLERELVRQAAMHGNPIHAKTLRLAPKQKEVAALQRLADAEMHPLAVITKSITAYRGLAGMTTDNLTGLTFIDREEVVASLDYGQIDAALVLDITIPSQIQVRRTETEIMLPPNGTYVLGQRMVDEEGRPHYAVTVSWE